MVEHLLVAQMTRVQFSLATPLLLFSILIKLFKYKFFKKEKRQRVCFSAVGFLSFICYLYEISACLKASAIDSIIAATSPQTA